MISGSGADTTVRSDCHSVSDVTEESEGSCGGVGDE